MFLQKVFRDFREVIRCAEGSVNATKPLHTYYLPLQLYSRNTLKDTIPLKLFLYQHSNNIKSNIKFVYKPHLGILFPDIVVHNPHLIIDVTCHMDNIDSLSGAYDNKVVKYSSLEQVLRLVIGNLGSWLPTNDHIRGKLGIPMIEWRKMKSLLRISAIEATTSICKLFFND